MNYGCVLCGQKELLLLLSILSIVWNEIGLSLSPFIKFIVNVTKGSHGTGVVMVVMCDDCMSKPYSCTVCHIILDLLVHSCLLCCYTPRHPRLILQFTIQELSGCEAVEFNVSQLFLCFLLLDVCCMLQSMWSILHCMSYSSDWVDCAASSALVALQLSVWPACLLASCVSSG